MAYKEHKDFKRKPIRRDVTPEVAEGTVIGRNAVRELLRSGRDVDKIFVQRGEREGSITMLVAEALERKIPVVEAEKPKLDAMAGGGNHQGIVAMAAQKAYATVDEILAIAEARGEKPFVLILDGVEDPHNLGAIIRSADVFGVHGVCGIVGCIMTGIFAAKSLGGVGYAEGVTMVHQVLVQLESIAITVVWSAVVAFIGYKLADMTVGLRVPEEQEREGLDVNSHGENAYNA